MLHRCSKHSVLHHNIDEGILLHVPGVGTQQTCQQTNRNPLHYYGRILQTVVWASYNYTSGSRRRQTHFFFFFWTVTCHWIPQRRSPNVPFTSVLKTFCFEALNVSSSLTIFQTNVHELSSALLSPFNNSFIYRTTLLINVPHLPRRQFPAAF